MRLSAFTLLALLTFFLVTPTSVFAENQVGSVVTLAPVVKKVLPSVVSIAIKGRIAQEQNPLFNDPFFRRFFNVPNMPPEREINASGSGVIIDAMLGLIITNNHVVEHADEIEVVLADSRHLKAKLLGADPGMDVAVVQIPAENLTAIAEGDSDKLEIGDFVVAVGNPFGLGQTVTSGIVSGLRRSGLGIEGYENFIQTDAAINPGNSGGALVNLNGELIGINTAIVGPGGGNVGIGFAIPVNMVRSVMDQLVRYGEVKRGQLGVMIQDLSPEIAQAMGLDKQQLGALISKVLPNSPASRAGLMAGDVITEVGSEPIRGSADLRNKIGVRRVDDTVQLKLMRKGKPLTMSVVLGASAGNLIQGGEISPLLEGVVFGLANPNASSEGIEVVSVKAGSKASNADLRQGDIIVSVNQAPTAMPEDFIAAVKKSPQRLLLNLIRSNSALFIFLE
jgi:Do/DeqQ family serine protease